MRKRDICCRKMSVRPSVRLFVCLFFVTRHCALCRNSLICRNFFHHLRNRSFLQVYRPNYNRRWVIPPGNLLIYWAIRPARLRCDKQCRRCFVDLTKSFVRPAGRKRTAPFTVLGLLVAGCIAVAPSVWLDTRANRTFRFQFAILL